jgi:hypothetical protein
MPETGDDRPTLIPTGDDDHHDTDPAPPPDFDDAVADPHEVHLFV